MSLLSLPTVTMWFVALTMDASSDGGRRSHEGLRILGQQCRAGPTRVLGDGERREEMAMEMVSDRNKFEGQRWVDERS